MAAPQHAPSAARNAAPILEVLNQHLPEQGRALEIASGTGQHVAGFACAFPGVSWLPSDPDPAARESIAAWIAQSGLANIEPPRDIDVTRPDWERGVPQPLDAVLAINLIHISPWAATEGLFAGAGRLLASGGLVYLYGAYRVDGEHTAQSNVRFEEWLKGLSPEYGVRDMADVEAAAAPHGLALAHAIPMPANNFSLIFRKN